MQRFVATPHNALSVRKRPFIRNRDSSYYVNLQQRFFSLNVVVRFMYLVLCCSVQICLQNLPDRITLNTCLDTCLDCGWKSGCECSGPCPDWSLQTCFVFCHESELVRKCSPCMRYLCLVKEGVTNSTNALLDTASKLKMRLELKQLEEEKKKLEEKIIRKTVLLETSNKEYIGGIGHSMNWNKAPLAPAVVHGVPIHMLERKLKLNDYRVEAANLYRSIRNNDSKTVFYLVQNCIRIEGDDEEKWKCLHAMFQEGNPAIIIAITKNMHKMIKLKQRWEVVTLAKQYGLGRTTINKLYKSLYHDNMFSKTELRALYSPMSLNVNGKDSPFIHCVIKTGIVEHIELFRKEVEEFILTHMEQLTFAQLKYLSEECVLSKSLSSKICNFLHVNEKLSPWSRFTDVKSTVFTSKTQQKQVPKDMIHKLYELVAASSMIGETKYVRAEIHALLDTIAEELGRFDPLLSCTPILVGSANEDTRCVPDEFDFQLLFLKLSEYFNISYNRLTYEGKITVRPNLRGKITGNFENIETLRQQETSACLFNNEEFYDSLINVLNGKKMAVITKLRDRGYPIHDIEYSVGRSFIVMNILRREAPYKINVDLVPAFPFMDNIHLPQHPLLDGSSEHIHYITVKSQFAKSIFNVSFAHIENKIIKKLPYHYRQGYKLAKTVRNCHVILPVIDRLQGFGVANDLEELIPSYVLKTCVLWMTQEGQFDEECTFVQICIQIYLTLQEFVKVRGEVPHFFHRKTGNIDLTRPLFSCQPQRDSTELICCRKKKAILLVVKQILSVFQSNPLPEIKVEQVDTMIDTPENTVTSKKQKELTHVYINASLDIPNATETSMHNVEQTLENACSPESAHKPMQLFDTEKMRKDILPASPEHMVIIHAEDEPLL